MKLALALTLLLGLHTAPSAAFCPKPTITTTSSSSTTSSSLFEYLDHGGPSLTTRSIGPESMGGKAYGVPRKSIMTPKEEWWHESHKFHWAGPSTYPATLVQSHVDRPEFTNEYIQQNYGVSSEQQQTYNNNQNNFFDTPQPNQSPVNPYDMNREEAQQPPGAIQPQQYQQQQPNTLTPKMIGPESMGGAGKPAYPKRPATLAPGADQWWNVKNDFHWRGQKAATTTNTNTGFASAYANTDYRQIAGVEPQGMATVSLPSSSSFVPQQQQQQIPQQQQQQVPQQGVMQQQQQQQQQQQNMMASPQPGNSFVAPMVSASQGSPQQQVSASTPTSTSAAPFQQQQSMNTPSPLTGSNPFDPQLQQEGGATTTQISSTSSSSNAGSSPFGQQQSSSSSSNSFGSPSVPSEVTTATQGSTSNGPISFGSATSTSNGPFGQQLNTNKSISPSSSGSFGPPSVNSTPQVPQQQQQVPQQNSMMAPPNSNSFASPAVQPQQQVASQLHQEQVPQQQQQGFSSPGGSSSMMQGGRRNPPKYAPSTPIQTIRNKRSRFDTAARMIGPESLGGKYSKEYMGVGKKPGSDEWWDVSHDFHWEK